jgi:hypothetical protein
MKDGLRGQYFPDNDAVIAACLCWRRPLRAGVQAPVHRWQKCITNGGDYVEK